MLRNLFLLLYKYQFFRNHILKKLFWLYKYRSIKKKDVVRNEFSDIKNILGKSNPTIIDGGANIGLYSMMLKLYFPKATIYCFEPQEIGTEKNLSMFDDVFIVHNALGDTNKQIEFNVSSYSEASSLLETKIDNLKEKTVVNMITLDSWAKQHNINNVDLLKLDLEGYDFYALQGAKELLKTTKLVFIEVNFGDSHWKGNSPTFFDIQQLLYQNGFKFFNFYDIKSDELGKLKGCNALFGK